MATREENLKKINTELEKLSDEQLDKVVGGFATVYIFLYSRDGDNVTYLKDPIGIPANLVNPASWIMSNISLFKDNMAKATSSYGAFRSMCQSFANDNASQWKKPLTWGNIVLSAGVPGLNNLRNMTSVMDGMPSFERFYA